MKVWVMSKLYLWQIKKRHRLILLHFHFVQCVSDFFYILFLFSSDESQPSSESGMVDPGYQPSPYRRASEPTVQQHKNTQNSQRRESSESNQLSSGTLQHFSNSYKNSSRRYSASDESEDSTMYQMPKSISPQDLSDTSPRQLSLNGHDERDVDMPYVIGQFKLENNLYRKPFFLNRASTFCLNSRESSPNKSNIKRTVSASPKHSLRSRSSVIYEEIAL